MDEFEKSINELLNIEEKLSAFDIYAGSVPIWERIRHRVFIKLRKKFEPEPEDPERGYSINDYIRGSTLWVSNFIRRNPFLSSEHDVMVVGHPRRKKLSDGYWWDIYCDPITESSHIDSIHFESADHLKHHTPAKTESLRYLDLIDFSASIQRRLGVNTPSLSSESRSRLEKVENRINQRLGTAMNLTKIAHHQLQDRRAKLRLYKKVVKKVDPKIAIIVVSYGKETFIEACHSMNVPVVELQHGIIYPKHLGYAFPGERTKSAFPDYLITWGEFWGEETSFPIPTERIIPAGYPHLDQATDTYNEALSQRQIVFISQPSIGKKLSKFAIEVSRHPQIHHNVVYKLHPAEFDCWKDEYPWLSKANIDVVDSSDPPLYQLFSESSAQIGVYSTAVVEGLAFGLNTYIYRSPFGSILSPLVDQGVADWVQSGDDVVAALDQNKKSFDRKYYFSTNAVERVTSTVNKLMNEGYCIKRPNSHN